MLLGVLAIDVYLIMDCDDARQMVCDLVHVHLEDGLAHLQDNGHAHELVPTFVGIEGCKV